MSRPGRSERHGRTLHIHAWHRSALQCPFGVRACVRVCVCVCVCVFVQDVAYAGAAGVCAMGWVKVSVSVYHGIVGNVTAGRPRSVPTFCLIQQQPLASRLPREKYCYG